MWHQLQCVSVYVRSYMCQCLPADENHPPLVGQQLPHRVVRKLLHILWVEVHERAIETHGRVVVAVELQEAKGMGEAVELALCVRRGCCDCVCRGSCDCGYWFSRAMQSSSFVYAMQAPFLLSTHHYGVKQWG